MPFFLFAGRGPPDVEELVFGNFVDAVVGGAHGLRHLFREAELYEARFRVDDRHGQFPAADAFRFLARPSVIKMTTGSWFGSWR